MSRIKPRIFKGARDFLPAQMIVREEIVKIMRSVFQKYGFEPLETPAIEYLNVLSGKYGDEADRLIYRLNYKTGTKDEAALHYDLTVPFSRVIAMNPHLPRPFKRYQIQPVWRADTPQPRQGRFREFYQCDVDAIGSKSMIVDAEIIALVHEILTALGFKNFLIKINNRKILNGIVQFIGLDASHTSLICRSIDKLDKVPFETVAKELEQKSYSKDVIEKLEKLIHSNSKGLELLEELKTKFQNIPTGLEGVLETQSLFNYLQKMGLPENEMRYEISLARGLDYYTGPIFETILPEHPHIGSLTGGGRYDELIGMFSGQETPAVGTSLGLDRIFAAMQQLEMLPENQTRTQVLVINFSENILDQNLELISNLRANGINAEIYLEAVKLKKQFSYADKKQIPYVLIYGENEIKNQTVTLKNLKNGEQKSIELKDLIPHLKSLF